MINRIYLYFFILLVATGCGTVQTGTQGTYLPSPNNGYRGLIGWVTSGPQYKEMAANCLSYGGLKNWEQARGWESGGGPTIGVMYQHYQCAGPSLDGTVLAQSNLPACSGTDFSRWTNCFGTVTGTDGGKYVGEVRDGKASGQGTRTWSNGDKYVGEWRNDKHHGQGTYTSADGKKYVGEYRDGKPNGQGTFTLPDGTKYVGEYRDGKPHGQGTYTSADGKKYVGEYRDGKPNGQGTYTWPNGDKYVGEWRDEVYHGQGRLTFADGRWPQEGIWENDKFVREQRIPDHIAGRTSQAAPPASQTTPPVAQAPRQVEPPRSTLSLSASASQPDANGVVTLAITTNSDTASLRVNGDEVGGRADGRYSVNRFAQIGSNNFEVIATDRYGNTKKQTVVVNREIQVVAERTRSLNPTLITVAKPRDAVAIIIGIEKYKRVTDADFANRDASAFYDYARRALGIKPENIRLLVDDKADAAEILRSFKTWLPSRVNKNTTDVYVFYSGHGLPSEDGGSLYFLPHEVDRDLLERTAITQKEVVQAIQRTTPKSVTMFIDSCYSGQSRTGTSLLASARPISIAPKASTDFPSNFMVISASAPDQISSSSPELKHGIFSYYLMLGMEGEADVNKDGQITVGEMQTYLSQQVTRRASGMNRTQSPQTTGDLSRVLVQASSKTR